MDSAAELGPPPRGSWRRGVGIEFDRVANVTDAVFAIALTLLVLDLGIPALKDSQSPAALLDALRDEVPRLIGFAVAFILLGRYWATQHTFFAMLRAIDRRFITLLFVYLAFVALLPFPTSLVGRYEGNPLAVILLALTLSTISAMQVVLFAHARRAGLLRRPIAHEVFRAGLLQTLAPVIVLVGTLPLAFLSTTLTLIVWNPLTRLLAHVFVRDAPPDAAAWLDEATGEA